MAAAEVAPTIARVDSLPAVGSSADELVAERVLLAIIAVLAAVLVPGHADRLMDARLTWADLACGVRGQRPCAVVSG